MWNDCSCYKRITFNVVCFFILVSSLFVFMNNPNTNIVWAESNEIENEINENIDNILNVKK